MQRGVRFSVYIDCNVFFAWELAEVAATYFGMKTCVMAVSQRTQRKLNYFADIDVDLGVTSPLQRAKKTLEYCLASQKHPVPAHPMQRF